MDYTIVVASTASDCAPLQYIAPYAGTAIAEHFMHKGKDVLIVEDIIDSGRTLAYLIEVLKQRGPKDIHLCTLLDKPERRVKKQVKVDYTCFTIPDEFVVGYGLDYDQKYRNLPYIGVVEQDQEETQE